MVKHNYRGKYIKRWHMHKDHSYDIYNNCFWLYRANIADKTKLLSLGYGSLEKASSSKKRSPQGQVRIRSKLVEGSHNDGQQKQDDRYTVTSAGEEIERSIRREKNKGEKEGKAILTENKEHKHQTVEPLRYLGVTYTFTGVNPYRSERKVRRRRGKGMTPQKKRIPLRAKIKMKKNKIAA